MIAINMEMPKSCSKCQFKVNFPDSGLKNGVCNDLSIPFFKHPYCPLVEIITCKDCKYNKNGICPNYRHFVDDDFYCGDAIRKE